MATTIHRTQRGRRSPPAPPLAPSPVAHRKGSLRRALCLVMLFVLAAAYMRLGLLIPIDWGDEGQIVSPMWRVAEGEVPYRDFQHLYGPSLFYLGGLLFRLFGSDLVVLRYFLLALKAATCVMVYLGARRISGRPLPASPTRSLSSWRAFLGQFLPLPTRASSVLTTDRRRSSAGSGCCVGGEPPTRRK